jgi:hypothetical protein
MKKTAMQEALMDLAERADNGGWTRPQVTKLLRLLAAVRIRRQPRRAPPGGRKEGREP